MSHGRAVRKILLQVDQKARDLPSVLFVGDYLRDMGVDVAFCNKFTMLPMALRYRPDVFVMAGTHGDYRALAKHVGRWCKLVLMTQEGACATKEATVLRHTLAGLDEPCYLAGLSRVYLWGHTPYEWLRQEKVYPDDIMRVVGTSRLDVYRALPRSARISGRRVRIGIANRGAAVNPVDRLNPVRIIDEYRRREGSHRAYIDKGREWEDWIWHGLASLRVTLDVIERLCADGRYQVVFRPDPFERTDSYRFLKHKYRHFRLNTDPILFRFIDEIDVLVTEFSTTGTEAFILEKPVISTQRLLGPRLEDHNGMPHHFNPEHVRLYWQPATIDELVALIERTVSGTCPYSPDIAKAERYLRDIYGWPGSGPSAAYVIARDLKELAEAEQPDNVRRVCADEYEEHPLIRRVMQRWHVSRRVAEKVIAQPWLFSARALVSAVRGKRLAAHRRMEYYSLNVRETREVWSLFEKLKATDTESVAASRPGRPERVS